MWLFLDVFLKSDWHFLAGYVNHGKCSRPTAVQTLFWSGFRHPHQKRMTWSLFYYLFGLILNLLPLRNMVTPNVCFLYCTYIFFSKYGIILSWCLATGEAILWSVAHKHLQPSHGILYRIIYIIYNPLERCHTVHNYTHLATVSLEYTLGVQSLHVAI